MLCVHESRRGWRAERGQPAGFSAFRPCVSPTEGAWAGEVQLKGMVHRNVGPGMWASAWSVFPPSFTLERNRLKRHVSPERKGWCDAHTFVYLHPLGAACGASPPPIPQPAVSMADNPSVSAYPSGPHLSPLHGVVLTA